MSVLAVTSVAVPGDPHAVRRCRRVLYLLGAAAYTQHVVPVLAGGNIRVCRGDGHQPRPAAGVHLLLLQPDHVLLHEPQVQAVLPERIHVLQVSKPIRFSFSLT